MKKAFAFIALVILGLNGLTQSPGIRWQRTIGASNWDNYFFTVKTNDNGIITVGYSMFSAGEGYVASKYNKDGVRQWQKLLTGVAVPYVPVRAVSYVYRNDGSLAILFHSNDGEALHHVFVIDNNGNIVWENAVSPSNSAPSCIISSATGGLIIAGNTASTAVPGHHGPSYSNDGYLVKYNATYGLEWQKALGGSNMDGSNRRDSRAKVVEAADGSIYYLTETSSLDGDVIGNNGGYDLWLVKLNSGGGIVWAKCFGGANNEIAVDLKLSPSGDICLLGNSESTDLTINGIAQTDLYFARVSPLGDLLFQKCFGSTSGDEAVQIVSTDNDGYVLVGHIRNGDGNIQGYHGTPQAIDIWIFKIDNNGNILWQKAIGGSGGESIITFPGGLSVWEDQSRIAGGVSQTSDGGYLISAITYSSDGDVIGQHSTSSDILVAKLSGSGTLEWTRCLGGSNSEIPKGPPVEFAPREYLIGGYTLSNNGDIQVQYGMGDGWLVKLGAVNTIKGTVFIDQNSNGIKDAGETPFSAVKIDLSKRQDSWTVVPYNGNFLATSDTGTYVSTLVLEHPYYNVVPTQHTSNFSTYFNTDSFSFALQPIPGQKDLTVNVSPITPARPGFLIDYEVSYKNAGNVSIPSGQILFKKDVRLQYISSVPAISSSNGDTLKWDYTNLDPAGTGLISLKLRLAPPPTVNIGDSVISTAIITPVAGDVTPADDTMLVKQFVQGSYDPNDKAETAGLISMAQIAAGDYLNYVIRFQNTGNDVAFNISVRDTLDANLDWSSFEMIGSSHPYQLEINDDNKLSWNFYNILLADSVHNEPASHGYIAYRIKPKATLVNGNLMKNKASIYFDFNLPVVTNETVSRVGVLALIGTLPVRLVDFNAKYEKPDATLEWSTADESNVDKFVIERGTDPIHFVQVGTVSAKGNNSNSVTRYQFKDPLSATSGEKFYYRLRMTDIDRKFSFSNIQLITRDGKSVSELVMNPNPVKGRTGFAWLNLQKETMAEIGVLDMKGNYRSLGKQRINKGFNVVPLDFFGLSDGTYLLEVKIGQERLISRFVLVQ